ncbi:calmodulin-binding transcription activator 1 isoform X1 [Ovis aries]|uniref:calmodulin-binding transcription activator 1 isoform X1 n=2 Tax=Laurasiatheria TaxID=314145 RepID=UPI0029526A05|nr:calmodulin-binding transcription activator 1 isoform X1 [Ovis aries]
MWRAEGKWLPKTSRKSVSQSVFCGTSTYCVLNTVPPLEDDHGNSNSSHVKIFLPKKLLECLPKCSSLPKERHRWNTNEVDKFLFLGVLIFLRANLLGHLAQYYYMLALNSKY